MWIDTQADSESLPHGLLLWAISSGFPLANHFDLPGSDSIFGISQDRPMYVHSSLIQDGFHQKGLWVKSIS